MTSDQIGQNLPESEKEKEKKRTRVDRERAMAVGSSTDYSFDDYDYDTDDEMEGVVSTTAQEQNAQKIMNAASQARDYVVEKISAVGENLKELQEISIRDLADSAREYARQNPFEAMLLSSVAGLALGLIIRASLGRKPQQAKRRPAVRVLIDFNDLVNETADEFEMVRGITVDSSARKELLEPALEYQDHVDRELAYGQITIDFLKESLSIVLENAQEIATKEGKTTIDKDAVKKSTKRYCPYLFWC